ncbi:RHS repeat-associated core domain-containing protein [Cryomorpha ignava]|uniref:RHS repeat-associated core domain-containing protein n=1 Tax=Cryomorpha ignava TaxID=101383 RepID=A0A7K3WWB4_9FLAO|nr:RHS repeat-associated core domain-containing protein [Cryomorpha ignava]
MKHVADGHANQDFIRDYTYDSSDNKLKGFTVNSITYGNTYDPNGSLTKEGQSRYYEWGANDKLAVFKNQAGSSTPSVYTNYFYNAKGDRIKKHTRKGNKIVVTFYMDGGMFETTYTKTVGGSIDNNRFFNTIKISDDGALIATIRVGNNVDDDTPAIKYIVGDHLNNSSAVLKTTGTLINREEYYPFGETSFGSYQYKRYRYNGKEKDEESGLYEYGQRYYAPWLCRFVSVDPIAEDYPQLSSYNYAGNKPITHVDIEGLQSSDDSEKKSEPNFNTYTSPSGDTFIASGVHNVASAKGKSEVMTTAGVMVETRTNAVLQFDWGGNNYKAHFSSETLDFTGYKDKDGNAFPIEYSSGQYFADLHITVEEKGDGALAFTAVISGAENWVWNESVFSFDIPIDFNSSQGFSLDNLLGSPTVSKNDTISGGASGGGSHTSPDLNIPSSISGKSEFTGRIYFDSLDQDLPSLLQGLRVEYIENIINVGKLGSNLDASIGGNFLKASNANFQTVIRATQYTGSLGLQEKSKMSKAQRKIGNINPTLYDFRASWGKFDSLKISNPPTRKDSIKHGHL